MRRAVEEKAILNQALEAFRATVPTAKVRPIDKPNLFGKDEILKFTIDERKFEYVPEIRPTATETTKTQILIQKQRTPRLLLVTRYVNPRLAEDFVRDDIEYLDTVGNVFMHQPNLFIQIKGNKAPTVPRDVAPARPFLPKGLKVVFALLCENDLINRTYREIAERAGVALGTVALVIKELQLLGFVIRKKENVTLINKAQLLDRWVGEYNQRLRPKQFIGRYRVEPGWWEQGELPRNKAWWGGEVGAARLTTYLRPEVATLYTTREYLHELAIQNRLKKDEAGNVEIFEKFWGLNIQGLQKDLVHPILIYADLLATGNKRNIEAAKMIYDRDIIRLIGKE